MAERRPEIANDVRQMADDLNARTRKPAARRKRPIRVAGRERLRRLLPVLKFDCIGSGDNSAGIPGAGYDGRKAHSAVGRRGGLSLSCCLLHWTARATSLTLLRR